MSLEVSFFTPIKNSFDSHPTWRDQDCWLELVDSLFSLSDEVAQRFEKKDVPWEFEAVILTKKEPSAWYVKALKVASYCTLVIPALGLVLKLYLRSSYRFQYFDTKGELERQFNAQAHLSSLNFDANGCVQEIIRLEQEITSDSDRGDARKLERYGDRFSLKKYPGVTFIGEGSPSTWALAGRMQALEVCKLHHLYFLRIPPVRMLEFPCGGKLRKVAVEKEVFLDLNQESNYEDAESWMAISQLVKFIALTGHQIPTSWFFPKDPWSMIPMENGHITIHGIDHPLSDLNPATGIYGDRFAVLQSSAGLVECMRSATLVDQVIEKAKELGVVPDRNSCPEDFARKKAIDAINYNQNLDTFYQEQAIGMDYPDKPVEIGQLAKGKSQKWPTSWSSQDTVETVFLEIVGKINDKIKAQTQSSVVKTRACLRKSRRIELYLSGRAGAGTIYGDRCRELFKQLFEGLVKQGAIFAWGSTSERTYWVQA